MKFIAFKYIKDYSFQFQILLEFSLLFFFFCHFFSAEAYDALDPTGNITIKWDVMSWTPDGYVVSVN